MMKKRTDVFDYGQQRTCPTCSNIFSGKFCNRCGEKVIDQRERSIRHFLAEIVNAFTFLDGKFPRSIKTVLVSPGKLSFDVVRGIKIPYMKPVSLFFVANFLYFLFPLFEAFNTSLNSQLKYQQYSEWVQQLVDRKIENRGITFSEFELRYNESSTSKAKLMLVVVVFLFSIVLSVINFSRNAYYADHLTVSFEFMAYTLLFTTISLSVLLVLVVRLGVIFETDLTWILYDEKLLLLPLIFVFTLYFLYRMQVKFYTSKWWIAAVKALLLFFGFTLVVTVYRFILFFVTFWTI
ncbi:MAG: DUF3667 domain-containing protein [Cyclobacteriaceae bacterium]|nr:DUF3667 domain-containing protein [Cyclobacteriaceae bacterium]